MLTSEAARIVSLGRTSSDARVISESIRKLPKGSLNGDSLDVESITKAHETGKIDDHTYVHRVKCRLQHHWTRYY